MTDNVSLNAELAVIDSNELAVVLIGPSATLSNHLWESSGRLGDTGPNRRRYY